MPLWVLRCGASKRKSTPAKTYASHGTSRIRLGSPSSENVGQSIGAEIVTLPLTLNQVRVSYSVHKCLALCGSVHKCLTYVAQKPLVYRRIRLEQ
jgi:hypothetical protein